MEQDSADRFLVDEIRSGSQDAWRQLIGRYSGRLLAFARARTGTLGDAEDLVQETFVGFIQSLSHYDPARSLETYLFTILRYKLYDLLRQKRINVISPPADADDFWERVVPGTEETPSEIVAKAEDRRRHESLLGEMLRRLIHESRDRGAFGDLQVIELVFFAGKRNLDIGELLDIDQKAVAGIKFRAIQKLKKYLEERDASVLDGLDETAADITIAQVWREERITCLKRSTLGSYLLGVLDEPWLGYTQFHLDVVGCPMCLANLQDLEDEEDDQPIVDTEQVFASSVGFLKKSS